MAVQPAYRGAAGGPRYRPLDFVRPRPQRPLIPADSAMRHRPALALAMLAALATVPAAPVAAQRDGRVVPPAASGPDRRVLSPVRPLPAGRAPRILVYHDMEGLAGQDDWRTFDFEFPEHYARGQRMLVADLSAVIAGLFEGGAGTVHVVDAHGSGNPEPDVPPGALDRRVTQVIRDRPFRQYVDLVAPDLYDAIVVVGMHARTGSGGFASHTFTMGTEWIYNGMPVSETEIIGYSWGRVGVPVIMATGDDRLRDDLRPTMPWLRYVTVKESTSGSTARLRPVEEVHREMRATAAAAVRSLPSMQAMRLVEPIHSTLRVIPPASLAILRNVPGITIDSTLTRVDFIAPDFAKAYDGVVALTNVAESGYAALWREAARGTPEGERLARRYVELLTARWLDVESGRWQAPPAGPPRTRFFGAR